MTRIFREICLCTDKKKRKSCKKLKALFDSGATYSHIDSRQVEGFEDVYREYSEPEHITLATKDKTAEIIGDLSLYAEIEDCFVENVQLFRVTKGLKTDVIIGADIMESLGIVLDPKDDKLFFKKCPPDVGLI